MILSILYAAVASLIGVLRENHTLLVGAATVAGFALWIGNFYVIAPFTFPWFGMVNPLVQFVVHTFFFGLPLGLLLASRSEGEEE